MQRHSRPLITSLAPDNATATATPSSSCAQKTHVVKRLLPTQSGALKWARRYGEALVCIRYRHDEQAQHRYTTVELLVDQAPVNSRTALDELVLVHIDFDNAALRQLAIAKGAEWDSHQRLWRMTRRLAKQLRLARKIVGRC